MQTPRYQHHPRRGWRSEIKYREQRKTTGHRTRKYLISHIHIPNCELVHQWPDYDAHYLHSRIRGQGCEANDGQESAQIHAYWKRFYIVLDVRLVTESLGTYNYVVGGDEDVLIESFAHTPS